MKFLLRNMAVFSILLISERFCDMAVFPLLKIN